MSATISPVTQVAEVAVKSAFMILGCPERTEIGRLNSIVPITMIKANPNATSLVVERLILFLFCFFNSLLSPLYGVLGSL